MYFIISSIILGCNEKMEDDIEVIPEYNNLPETEVYIQGNLVRPEIGTKGNYKWPFVNSVEGWESARFSIRADGTIPGYIDQSSSLYFGRSAGKVGNNKGKVYIMYPYGRYNDRDLDYYQKNKKTGENIGMFRYVFDPEGVKTKAAILEAPTVLEILEDEHVDLVAAISKGQNLVKNQENLEKLEEMMEKGEDYLEKHVLWYVVKEVGMKNGWHVNGIISENEVSIPIFNVPNNVEVDIHQQIHKDWNEIKTSIHVRADIERIIIKIPLKQEDIIEKDDFNIRVFDYDCSEYHITNTITHDKNGITLDISGISSDLIKNLKESFGDGLTIEVHSYCTTSDIWEQLKKSVVVMTEKPGTICGQISSAMKPEEEPIPIYVNK